jgi:hypothetical protein
VVIAAAQLLQEFQNDPAAADDKYRGKCLELTGVVEREGQGRDGIPFVILHAGDDNARLKIECYFDVADEEDAIRFVKLGKGQTITLRGEYQGQVANVQLRECSLIKGPPPAAP